jgi:putative membrane protein
MTRSKYFAFVFQGFFLLTFLFFMTACENRAGKDPKEVAEEQNNEIDKQTEEDMNKERDEDFLIKATEINMEEIQLGQLAQQKATMADVKNLAKMMTDEHSKALADLSALAGRKSIVIPTSTTDKVKNAYDKLNEKAPGNDFDKEYCDMMVKGHKDAIDAFERAANNAHDPDIKSWASSMLPSLRTHLDHAMACEAKLKDVK